MDDNFCVANLGLDEYNFTQDEYYINAIIKSNQLHNVNNIIQSLEYLVRSKDMLYQKIILEGKTFSFKENVTDTFDIKFKNVESYEDIVEYSHTDKEFVKKHFTYELVLFNCKKENKRYLYASFFHLVIDGVGGYMLLQELMEYLTGKSNHISRDTSHGRLSDINVNNQNSNFRVIAGDIEKKVYVSKSYQCQLTDEYDSKFKSIMHRYGLSYLELSILIFCRLNYLFPNINLNTVDCILNLRSKKTLNKLGMYANILPLEFDFEYDFFLNNMIKKIRMQVFQSLKKRTYTRYDFGMSKSNCLISMIYNHLDHRNYSVEWLNPDNIFYEYFITVLEGDNLLFNFQIDENISFDIQEFSEDLCHVIDYMYATKSISKLADIRLKNDIEPLPLSFNTATMALSDKLRSTLNADAGCYIFGKEEFSSKDIRQFILENCGKFGDAQVVCIKGGTAEEQILIALAALYAGKSYSFISGKVPVTYVEYLVKSLNGKVFCPNNFAYKSTNDLQDGKLNFRDIPKIICYFMTSGTTGFPKLIPVKALSISAFIDEQSSSFTKVKATNLLTTDLSFDLSLHAVFNTLCNGGTLVIADLNSIYESRYIERLISDNQVTHVLATPSFLSLIDYTKIKASTIFAAVGEILPRYTAEKIIENNFKLFNVYGPTETTCYVTEIEINNNNVDTIPIGKSIKGVGAYIIDGFGNFVPEKHEGEIVISGPTVFDGYVGGKGKEFITIDGVVYYKTGDIGYAEKGTLYFSHRKDKQIKIDGYRIEFGKIEEVISSLLLESHFYLTVIENSIVLFYTSKIDAVELKKQIQKYLPRYMVPQRILKLAQIPLTKNYKIDEHKLKLVDQESRQLRYPATKATKKTKIISKILLDLGVDLNNARNFKIKNCGLSSMQIFFLQKKLFAEGYQLGLEKLFNLTVEELILINPKSFSRKRDYDEKFPNTYDPSNIQNKFIINYLKNRKSTIDNIGAVIHFKDHQNAVEVCQFIREKILINKNLHYHVSFKAGKLFMKLNPDFDIGIQEINIANDSDIKKYTTNFDLLSGPLCNIKLLNSPEGFTILAEFHHVIIDGISLKELISSNVHPAIPYQNYRKILVKDENDDVNVNELKTKIDPFFDRTKYHRNNKLASGHTTVSLETIKKIACKLNVSHEAIFATAYVAALGIINAVVCTPVNLRQFSEDNFITGPLINLSGFRVSVDDEFKSSVIQTEKSLNESLRYTHLDLEKIIDADIFMTHLLTIFDSYCSKNIGKIDYELSNSLYDDKFKMNTYIYAENGVYTLYLNSYYLTNDEIKKILQELKYHIEIT